MFSSILLTLSVLLSLLIINVDILYWRRGAGIELGRMATIGRLETFDSSVENWETYEERLEQYFLANSIEPNKQVPSLLSLIGGKTYTILRNLTAPAKPSTKNYAELCEILRNHFSPKPLVIVERFRFHKRNQHEGENVQQYVAELKKLAQFCEFGNNLTETLRDRLVCGISSVSIQKRLLSVANITLERAVEIASAMEMADKDALELHGKQATPTEVHKLNREGGKKSVNSGTQYQNKKPCYRCGGQHAPNNCFYKESECYICSKKGHIAKVCRAKKSKTVSQQNSRRQSSANKHLDCVDEEEEDSDVYQIFKIQQSSKIAPYAVEIGINGTKTKMEIDTGAAVTILSEKAFHQIRNGPDNANLKQTNAKIRTYTGEQISVLGEVEVPVQYNGKMQNLSALVVQGNGPSLVGRDWLSKVRLDWHEIFYENLELANQKGELETILKQYPEVFKTGMGTLKGFKATIKVDHESVPKYWKPRPVPYSIRNKVDQELDRLVQEKIIEPVQFSDWAAPIVPIVKPDGTIRICGDYKVTLNKVSKLDKYPIPKCEDLLATIGAGQKFTKLDLRHAYLQVELEEDSKPFTTISTHRGIFQYNRLPFGVSSSPGIFQRAMEHIIEGIPNVKARLDDILLTGPNDEVHMSTLKTVLERLEKAGVRLNLNKCKFMVPEVVFCGRVITATGTKPVPGKADAIKNAPTPKNVTELRSFLGMLNFHHADLPNISSVLEPLRSLLRKEVTWKWGSKQKQAFEEAKNMLSSEKFLVHYDSEKELILECDASEYGVGAVISHTMENGSQRPIAYASRTLAPAERNYAQIDKEALAIVYGVKKFHQYIYGRNVVIYTDHKPLLGLLGEDKPIPGTASPRMQRWALTLSGYEYTLKYMKGVQNVSADCLSRLPLAETVKSVPETGETILLMDHLDSSAVTSTQIRNWTRRDPVLSEVMHMIQTGWPKTCPGESYRPYFHRRNELTVESGCVLWGNRVVIPPQGQSRMIENLHEMHPGICRMKSLARSYMWWPKIDQAIENKVQKCQPCQVNRKSP